MVVTAERRRERTSETSRKEKYGGIWVILKINIYISEAFIYKGAPASARAQNETETDIKLP